MTFTKLIQKYIMSITFRIWTQMAPHMTRHDTDTTPLEFHNVTMISSRQHEKILAYNHGMGIVLLPDGAIISDITAKILTEYQNFGLAKHKSENSSL